MLSSYKRKVFLIWSNRSLSFKTLGLQLEQDGWRVESIWDSSALDEHNNKDGEELVCMAIFNPSERISQTDIQRVRAFCEQGNSLLVCSGDNEAVGSSALNGIVSAFGVHFRSDCVIRPNLYGNYHPKEVFLTEFAANRGLLDALKRQSDRGHREELSEGRKSCEPQTRLEGSEEKAIMAANQPRWSLLYAFGCTLKLLSKLSTVMMTSSKWSLPAEQSLCAFYRDPASACRVVMLGSSAMLSDSYICKESNLAFSGALVEFMEDKSFSINISDARTIEIPLYPSASSSMELLDVPIWSLPEAEELPENKWELFRERVFHIDCSLLPTISQAYNELKVPYGRLSLMRPNLFFRPLRLEPGTHEFVIRRRLEEEQSSRDK